MIELNAIMEANLPYEANFDNFFFIKVGTHGYKLNIYGLIECIKRDETELLSSLKEELDNDFVMYVEFQKQLLKFIPQNNADVVFALRLTELAVPDILGMLKSFYVEKLKQNPFPKLIFSGISDRDLNLLLQDAKISTMRTFVNLRRKYEDGQSSKDYPYPCWRTSSSETRQLYDVITYLNCSEPEVDNLFNLTVQL